jgi:hypothetical protein
MARMHQHCADVGDAPVHLHSADRDDSLTRALAGIRAAHRPIADDLAQRITRIPHTGLVHLGCCHSEQPDTHPADVA